MFYTLYRLNLNNNVSITQVLAVLWLTKRREEKDEEMLFIRLGFKTLLLVLLIVYLSIMVPHVFSAAPPLEWGQTYGGPYDDAAFSVVQTSDGGYACVRDANYC
jgi:hypothetical protein